MERFIVSVQAQDPVSVLRRHEEGPWVLHSEAQAAIDAATKRADEAELWLRLVQSQKAITDKALEAGLKQRNEWIERAEAAEEKVSVLLRESEQARQGTGCLNLAALRARYDSTHAEWYHAKTRVKELEAVIAESVDSSKVPPIHARLALAEKERDEQAGAVKVLGRDLRELAVAARKHIDPGEQACQWTDWIDETVWKNPIAAAAVKEAGGG
jgi:hypothetical protein